MSRKSKQRARKRLAKWAPRMVMVIDGWCLGRPDWRTLHKVPRKR